jgi:glucosamine 6-phosphate synthetase-like amidotransferase/phosphosugar isomerase protein
MHNNMLAKNGTREDSFLVQKIIANLFENSEGRGRLASGLAFTTPQDVTVIKKDITGSEFTKTDEYKQTIREHTSFHFSSAPKLISIIGHCRWPTKGSEKDKNNNHPIIAENLIGVHNGVITNDENIFSMFKHTAGFGRSGLVDSEVIFRLIQYYRSVRLSKKAAEPMAMSIGMALRMLKGGYACAMVDAHDPWMMWLFRNTAPTDVRYYKNLGIVIFSTSDHIISESVEGMTLGDYDKIKYSFHEAVEFDFSRNKYFTFNHRADKDL